LVRCVPDPLVLHSSGLINVLLRVPLLGTTPSHLPHSVVEEPIPLPRSGVLGPEWERSKSAKGAAVLINKPPPPRPHFVRAVLPKEDINHGRVPNK
jgi:hypothetical protein